jgi:hypothetical protein
MSANATIVTDFGENRYLAYPHSNGFADGGASLVIGQIEEKTVSLWKRHLASGKETRLGVFPVPGEPPRKVIWFDIAGDVNRMIAAVGDALWLFDLTTLDTPKVIYRAPAPYSLNSLSSITADGRQALVGLHLEGQSHKAVRVDLQAGGQRVVIEHPWFANHFHFSPADPNWIGYCHEGPTEGIPDRVWAFHPTHAPQGRCLFDQASAEPPKRLCVGHERWAFHAPSALAVAYGVSPAGPRGLYEVFVDGRPARLVSPGERDWHCDVSRDGRWAVVDTTGPHDAPGHGWQDARDISDILLVDMKTGTRQFLARSHQAMHPRHPHPVFSPDGATIFFNEAESGGARNRIVAVHNPWAA